jgi:anti-anti-sigma factor
MLYAHDEPGALTIDVAGPATMTESPAVHATASERMSRGVRVVRIDLRDCAVMDSTFSGTLLALKRELERRDGTLTLVAPSPKVVELLAQMGLDGFYDIDARGERGCGPWEEISTAAPSVERLRSVVVEAHEELVRLPGRPAEVFRDVARELRR